MAWASAWLACVAINGEGEIMASCLWDEEEAIVAVCNGVNPGATFYCLLICNHVCWLYKFCILACLMSMFAGGWRDMKIEMAVMKENGGENNGEEASVA